MRARIVEVISRSEQGITRPFLCRGDDGRQYFVKGSGAGRHALMSEWIAGRIAQRFGLPIPTFVQAVIPADLVQFSAREDIRDLGAGVGFGSQLVENVDELAYLFIEQIDPAVRAKILLFDWWICNADRTLTESGGNVNLLWTHRDQRLHVIDQNLAFDEEAMAGFWSQHVFRESARLWTQAFRTEMGVVMNRVLQDIAGYWWEMPEEWTEVETSLTLDSVQRILSRFQQNADIFWRAHE
jgi:hypothetical protein